MRPLCRDTSAYRFLTLSGLFARSQLPKVALNIETLFDEQIYKVKNPGFGPDERNVKAYLLDLLKTNFGWTSVESSHDILLTSATDKLLIECKHYNSRFLYLDQHAGGSSRRRAARANTADHETAVEELYGNMRDLDCKWGILTDGFTFRLY